MMASGKGNGPPATATAEGASEMTTATATITIPAETAALMQDIIAGYEAGEITASEITLTDADDTASSIMQEVPGSVTAGSVLHTAVARWYGKWHGTDRRHPSAKDGAWLTEIIDAMRSDLAEFPTA